MVVSKETSDCFTKLVGPLVPMQRLEEMFGKLKEEIIERFEEKFTAHNQKNSVFGGKNYSSREKDWKPKHIMWRQWAIQ